MAEELAHIASNKWLGGHTPHFGGLVYIGMWGESALLYSAWARKRKFVETQLQHCAIISAWRGKQESTPRERRRCLGKSQYTTNAKLAHFEEPSHSSIAQRQKKDRESLARGLVHVFVLYTHHDSKGQGGQMPDMRSSRFMIHFWPHAQSFCRVSERREMANRAIGLRPRTRDEVIHHAREMNTIVEPQGRIEPAGLWDSKNAIPKIL